MRLQRIIMRRVYAVWFARCVCRSNCSKLGLAFFFGWQALSRVSPIAVWQNARLTDGLAHYGYYAKALVGTEIPVQLLLFSGSLLTLLTLKDLLLRFGFFSRARFLFSDYLVRIVWRNRSRVRV